jgi:hypothetical protein
MSRSRFTGSPEAMADILKKYMKVPSFLLYTEALDSPKQPAKIVRHAEMWREIASLHQPLTFTQKFMESAFELAGEHCGKATWQRPLTKDEVKSWKTSISKQFRAMARHITQSTSASWCTNMLNPGASCSGGDEECDGIEEGIESESPQERDDEVDAEPLDEVETEEEKPLKSALKRRVSFKQPEPNDLIVKFDIEVMNA